MLFGEEFNCIYNLADQTLLVFATVDTFADLKRLLPRTVQNIVRIKTETYPFAESAVSAPLAEQIAV